MLIDVIAQQRDKLRLEMLDYLLLRLREAEMSERRAAVRAMRHAEWLASVQWQLAGIKRKRQQPAG
jgi:hypothetical protein